MPDLHLTALFFVIAITCLDTQSSHVDHGGDTICISGASHYHNVGKGQVGGRVRTRPAGCVWGDNFIWVGHPVL